MRIVVEAQQLSHESLGDQQRGARSRRGHASYDRKETAIHRDENSVRRNKVSRQRADLGLAQIMNSCYAP